LTLLDDVLQHTSQTLASSETPSPVNIVLAAPLLTVVSGAWWCRVLWSRDRVQEGLDETAARRYDHQVLTSWYTQPRNVVSDCERAESTAR